MMSGHALIAAFSAVGLLSTAGGAAAQDPFPVESQATFQGSAPAACLLSTPSATTTDNAVVGGLAPGSADISISQLVGDDGLPVGATIVLVLPALCNQAHVLDLASVRGGMRSDGPEVTTGPFRSTLPYQVQVDWAGGTQSYQSDDDALSVSVDDAAAGVITFTIQIPAGGAPLAAGAYSDELVLELGVAG